MNCKICGHDSKPIFNSIVLNKYNVQYFQCEHCKFIQTEMPYWLEEAYNSPIAKLDIGLICRNLEFSGFIENFLLRKLINPDGIFLDFGGGYGMFVRMMRDKGFNFYRQDRYCDNLFAQYWDVTDIDLNTKFDFLTAFEVFEHLESPMAEFEKMLSYSDTVCFSTELQPEGIINAGSWWYIVPETGQHISLYSYESLQEMAKRTGCILYSNKRTLHILSKKKLPGDPFKKNLNQVVYSGISFLQRLTKAKRASLLMKDFDYVKSKVY